MNWTINLIETVRSNRAQVHVPAGAKVPLVFTDLDAKGQAAWDNNHVLIQRLARIESLTKVDDLPKGCVTIPMPGGGRSIYVDRPLQIGWEIFPPRGPRGYLAP